MRLICWGCRQRGPFKQQPAHVNRLCCLASRQAADQVLIADMVAHARHHTHAATLALISSDHGFAQTLAYCRSLGCCIVSITRWTAIVSDTGLTSAWHYSKF